MYYLVVLLAAACRPDESPGDSESPVDATDTDGPDSGDDTGDSADDTGDSGASPREATAVTAGYRHSCAIWSDGEAACWGSAEGGALEVPAEGIAGIDAGGDFACGVRGGAVECWGGQGAAFPVTDVPAPGTWSSVSAGNNHACAVDGAGSLACWGRDTDGEATPPDGSWRDVSTGLYASCAIDDAGRIGCWGLSRVADAVPGGAWSAVSCARTFACAIDATGAVQCWGSDDAYGELDPGTAPALSSLSCGGFTCCGLDAAGAPYCWGRNDDGQAEPPAGAYRSLSTGEAHVCAITTTGTIDCWGRNDDGQAAPP